MINNIINNIKQRQYTVGIVGLGYVGLPLLIEFSKANFHVIGFDTDPEKVKKLKASVSYIKHIDKKNIEALNARGNFEAYSEFKNASRCDAILICVPTPLTKQREPDMSYIVNTSKSLSKHIKKGQLFVLESTTYPGTTDEVLKPILESSGLRAGDDFYLAFSPEREDPNNLDYTTSTIPKVVGGYNQESLEIAKSLYDCIICRTVPVSSNATAEATKLMENIFRCVNIALVNELKIVFEKMGINVWEVIDAAKTKPFGYMPFYPGPGLGGHCIPIDPFYLTWKAREFDYTTKFIELAGEINSGMPRYIISKTMEGLNTLKKSLNGSKVLIIGLAYKKNVDDIRESPAFKIWELLEEKGAVVSYYDPYCSSVMDNRHYPSFAGSKSIKNLDSIKKYDAVIISTDHDCVNYDYIRENANLVIDTRNAIKTFGNNVIKA